MRRWPSLKKGSLIHDTVRSCLGFFVLAEPSNATRLAAQKPQSVFLSFLRPNVQRQKRLRCERRRLSSPPSLKELPARSTNPINLEDLLDSSNPKTREERQLIWRAWTGLSDDVQATKSRLLDSLLETLRTEDFRDARRLRSLLDSKNDCIDTRQRAFYSFWAHSLLHETDIAFKHYLNIPLQSQLQYKELFLHRCVRTGDWSTGVRLWQLICEKTNRSWFDRSGKPELPRLLALIPNVYTLQFLSVIPSHKTTAFRPFVRRELLIYLSTRNDAHALELLRTSLDNKEQLSDAEIAAVMKSLVRQQKPSEALELYHELSTGLLAPYTTRRMTNVAIQASLKVDDISQIERLLQNEVISKYTRPELVNRLKEPLTTIMAAYARRGEYKDVEKLLALYEGTGQIPDIVMLGTVLQARVVALEVTKAREIFTSCESKYGVKPDKVLYNMLLQMYADTLDAESASETIIALSAAGFKPDQFTIATLIDLFAQRKDIDGAQNAFSLVQKEGIEPNVQIYGSLMNAFVEAGDVEGMRKIAKSIETAGIRPNSVIMNILLKGLLKDGSGGEDLIALVRSMEQFDVKATAATYSSIMQARVAELNIAEATAIFESLSSHGIKPNEYHYTIMMVGHLKIKDYATMKHYYEEMISLGLSPSFVTQAVLLNAFTLQGTPNASQLADQLLESLISAKPAIDKTSSFAPRTILSPDVFTVLMNQPPGSYDPARAKEIFNGFLQLIKNTDGRPDIRSLTSVMNAYRISNQPDQVLSIFNVIKAEADSLYRNHHSFTTPSDQEEVEEGGRIASGAKGILAAPLSILIDSLTRGTSVAAAAAASDGARQVEQVWDSMTRAGYAFDLANWNEYVRVSVSLGNLDRACSIVDTFLLSPPLSPLSPPPPTTTADDSSNPTDVGLAPEDGSGSNQSSEKTGWLEVWGMSSSRKAAGRKPGGPWHSIHRASVGSLGHAFDSLQRHGHRKIKTQIGEEDGWVVWERIKTRYPRVVDAIHRLY